MVQMFGLVVCFCYFLLACFLFYDLLPDLLYNSTDKKSFFPLQLKKTVSYALVMAYAAWCCTYVYDYSFAHSCIAWRSNVCENMLFGARRGRRKQALKARNLFGTGKQDGIVEFGSVCHLTLV